MKKIRQKRNVAGSAIADVREAGQNPAGLTRKAVNFEAVFDEPSFSPKNLMEAVVERSNMIKALARVKSNKGAPGVDGLKVEDLPEYLKTHWSKIKQWLLAGEYRPQPVRRVEIPKPDGGVRMLGIPTSMDRMIQQAIGQVLSPIFEPTFSESSFGFRPGRSQHQAVARALSYAREGRKTVVDIDLEKFFDRVNHDILMDRLSRRIEDKRILKLIRRYLEAGAMIGGLEEPRHEGTPQGGPLSPLLSNILLDDLDKELEERGHKFCRYADDCNIYVKSRKAGERVKASITVWLERWLRLKVNESKSAVAHIGSRKFLGYSMTFDNVSRLKPAAIAVERFKGKVRVLFKKGRGRNVERFIKEDLNTLLRGWAEYFRLSEVRSVFQSLDEWIRRKLRCLIWRQWKRPRTRERKLLALGISPSTARASAWNGRGSWWNSNREHMSTAFPNRYFDRVGLICIKQRVLRTAKAG
jgi:RNA-directed DNA polymerase